METTDNIIKRINEDNDIVCIAEYILELTKNYFSFEEAKKIAIFLVKEKQYKKQDILNSLGNNDILTIAKSKQMHEKSVQKKGDVKKRVPFKTKKKKIAIKVIISSLALIFVISAILKLNKSAQNYREDIQVSNLIGMAVTDENEKINIVRKNSYAFGHGDNRVIAYRTDDIASDIIKICNKNSELLDLVLYRTYFDMQYNRLANMDGVIRNLLAQANREDLTFITEDLYNCSSFLDYVFKKGYIAPNNPDYYKYQDAVAAYNQADLETEYAYNKLPKDVQKLINKLIAEYKKGRESLYPEFKDDLSELVEPSVGFNEGGRK